MDASGSWGCAALWNGLWFQVSWNSLLIANASIAPKELFPILVASVVWDSMWKGLTVCAHCDNSAVVEVLSRASGLHIGVMFVSRPTVSLRERDTLNSSSVS